MCPCKYVDIAAYIYIYIFIYPCALSVGDGPQTTSVSGTIERWYTHKLTPQDVLSEIFMHARLAENKQDGVTDKIDVDKIDPEALEEMAVDSKTGQKL